MFFELVDFSSHSTLCYVPSMCSVVALKTHHFAVGEQITMKLMKRERGTTYTMPRTQWTERCGKPHNVDGKKQFKISGTPYH